MKTLILQGEQHKFEYLYKSITLEDKDKDLIPYEAEIRVYVANSTETEIGDLRELADDEFMTEVERQGKVYTLQGFQIAVNYEELYLDESYIRFISVPLPV